MNSKKIEEIMKFVDGVQREANEDYALITQLRSSLFFLDKSLEQKQKDLEKVSEKLKGFFNAMIASDPEITHESASDPEITHESASDPEITHESASDPEITHESASEADEKVEIVDLNKS